MARVGQDGTGPRRGKDTPFRANLNRALEASSLKHHEVAARVGRGRGAVTAWVDGRAEPPLELLPALARALGVRVDDLLVGYPETRAARPLPDPQEVLLDRFAGKVKDVLRKESDTIPSNNAGYNAIISRLDRFERKIEEQSWAAIRPVAQVDAALAPHKSQRSVRRRPAHQRRPD